MRCLLWQCGEFLLSYKTINGEGLYEETEKRSRFISYCFSVETYTQVSEHLKHIKAKHPDAKHHVYAYILHDNFLQRYSDDGEPSGTAGTVVLGVIKSLKLENVLVIIVRYFGGVLLGSAGLRKMYGSAALGALKTCTIASMFCFTRAYALVDYKSYGKIATILKNHNAKIVNVKYLSCIEIDFYIKKDEFNVAYAKISDILKGNKNIETLGEKYFAI